jgi:2-polyprenyl-3-methyl-5-hydroxy-6-metoxy-1,4-benzoquinol methylase
MRIVVFGGLSCLEGNPELHREHEWIGCVTGPPSQPCHLRYDLVDDTLEAILARMPGGGLPDVILLWYPENQVFPQGLDRAPVPVVGVHSNWNLALLRLAPVLEVFDHLLVDEYGVEVIRSAGFDRVSHWPMCGHDPSVMRRLPDAQPVWDITMIGNLNHAVQRERAHWVARLARLGRRWRVRIQGGIYGEDYVRIVNQSRITFNRSIRGEMNMRAYEAAACGSLLFYEEGNREIGRYFEDGVHCVLYNDDNFEELVEHYLTHEDERRAIVERAAERVAAFSLPRQLLRLLDRLGEMGLTGPRPERDPWAGVSAVERNRRLARQAFYGTTPRNYEYADALFAEALRSAPDDAVLHADRAVVQAYLAERRGLDEATARGHLGAALQHAHRATALAPDSAIAQLNLGQLLKRCGESATAQTCLWQAISLIDEDRAQDSEPGAMVYPAAFQDDFRVELETAHREHLDDPAGYRRERNRLLLWRAGMAMGELAEQAGDAAVAARAYGVSALARPDLGLPRGPLGRLLLALGDPRRAVEQLDQALATDPFLVKAWPTYADALLATGECERAAEFLRDRLAMIAVIPGYQPIGPALRERLALAERPAAASSAPTRESVIAAARYRFDDRLRDIAAEYADYAGEPIDEVLAQIERFRRDKQARSAPRDEGRERGDEFYADTREFVLWLMAGQSRLPHLWERTRIALTVALDNDLRSYLDYGAGLGRDCLVFARHGLAVTHADIAGEETRFAEWRYRQRELDVEIADVRALPDRRWQAISCYDVLEHLDDPIAALVALAAHLEPGGALFLAVDLFNPHAVGHLEKNGLYAPLYHEILGALGLELRQGGHPMVAAVNAELRIYERTRPAADTVAADLDWARATAYPPARERMERLAEMARAEGAMLTSKGRRPAITVV